MDMSSSKDQEVQRAWHGWVVFTRMTTFAVIASVAVLGLMALFLL